MGSRKGIIPELGGSLFRHITGIYPDRFRTQYADEILGVLLQGLDDAHARGGSAVPSFIVHESGALMVSIVREHWHERLGWRNWRMNAEKEIYHRLRLKFLKHKLENTGKVVMLLAAVVLLWYGGLYAYAAAQIARAEKLGVFPTVEEAVYNVFADEFRGANAVRVNIKQAEPCFPDGKLPFIWRVTSTVVYDRIPEGTDTVLFEPSVCSFYHLKDGWVYMPGDNIPGLIGVIMELFGMQGVGDYEA